MKNKVEMNKRYSHYRETTDKDRFDAFVLGLRDGGHEIPKGINAITRCGLETNEGGEVTIHAEGFAFCSGRDQFCRKMGRVIALGRAQKSMA